MTSRLRAREKYKRAQYRLLDERCAEMGLGQVCVLCRIGVPGGSHRASAHHEILAKAELPGKANWDVLFSLQNIAAACSAHHERLGHLRLLWLKSMVVVGLARAEQYRVEPFDAYWQDAPYPPVAECFGQFGFGSRFFQSSSLPESLGRLYVLHNPEFDARRFCDFCPRHVQCKILTAGKALRPDPKNAVVQESDALIVGKQ